MSNFDFQLLLTLPVNIFSVVSKDVIFVRSLAIEPHLPNEYIFLALEVLQVIADHLVV